MSLDQMRAAMEAIHAWHRENITRPDEIAMSQEMRDTIAEEVEPYLVRGMIARDAEATIMGIPIVIDDALPVGRVEMRVKLRPGLTADELRRIWAAGYEFLPPRSTRRTEGSTDV